MDYKKLADLLYPNVDKTIDYYTNKYPKRDLPDGAEVTRIAPSPTGFLHLGTAYGALIDSLTAQKTNGIYYMRLEDTDQKREIENAGQIAYDMLCYYDITPDEGYAGDNAPEIGIYGSYVQSKRVEIYHTFAKHLVSIGRAFPCFCEKSDSKQDILDRRNEQLESSDDIESKDPCRNLTYEQIEQNIKQGKPFALRLLSMGDSEKTFEFVDLIKGKRTIRQNTKDIVLVKSNGIPPYSLAHLVDDTLMGTTIVVRGEEWYASLAAHIELFEAFGYKPPKYAHTPVICKLDENGNKRKLSKRKDPEADARYYVEHGYPKIAINEYLINLLNSDFETWRNQNPTLDYKQFDFNITKIGSNNPMFDFGKLNDVSKNHISRLSATQVYDGLAAWAQSFDKEFYEYITQNREYVTNVLNIDRDCPKPRKDIAKYSEVKQYFDYMFDLSEKDQNYFELDGVDTKKLGEVLKEYISTYNQEDDKQMWFDRIKQMAEKLGYATDNKLYKANPQDYKGNTADVCTYIRLALTGRKNSPDIYSIAKILGTQNVVKKLENLIKFC